MFFPQEKNKISKENSPFQKVKFPFKKNYFTSENESMRTNAGGAEPLVQVLHVKLMWFNKVLKKKSKYETG